MPKRRRLLGKSSSDWNTFTQNRCIVNVHAFPSESAPCIDAVGATIQCVFIFQHRYNALNPAALELRAMLSLRSGYMRGHFAATRVTRFVSLHPESANMSRKLRLPLSCSPRPGAAFTEFVDLHRMSLQTKRVYELMYTEIASVVRNVLGVPSCPVELRGSIASGAAVESSDLDIWVDNSSHDIPALSKDLEAKLTKQLECRLIDLNLTSVEPGWALQDVKLESQAKGLRCTLQLNTGQAVKALAFDVVFRKTDGHPAIGHRGPDVLDTPPLPGAIIAFKALAAHPERHLPALPSRFYNGLVRLAWARTPPAPQRHHLHHHHHHQGSCSSLRLFTNSLRLLGEYSCGDAGALLEDLQQDIDWQGHRLISGEQMKAWQHTAANMLDLFRRYECSMSAA
jgi:predicted nucleotidyltransferase